MKYLIFTVRESQFAIKLTEVERVLRAVEVTPIPNQPTKVMGVINIQGWITPVVDTCKLFNLPCSDVDVNDRFIIIKTEKRKVALVANDITGVIEKDWQEVVDDKKIVDRVDFFNGIIKLPDGMVIIINLDKLLSAEEELMLDKYVSSRGMSE